MIEFLYNHNVNVKKDLSRSAIRDINHMYIPLKEFHKFKSTLDEIQLYFAKQSRFI